MLHSCQQQIFRTDPVHRGSHTRWGLGRDYRNLVLPLQSAVQGGWFEPRTSWHKWGGPHHCTKVCPQSKSPYLLNISSMLDLLPVFFGRTNRLSFCFWQY